MKKKLLLPVILLVLFLTACGQTDNSIAPFTDVKWGNTLEQICEIEGSEYEESLSMSGGYNYIYPKQYLDFDGYVKYNIDEDGTLSGISWYYIGDDDLETVRMYSAIRDDTTKHFGKEVPLDNSNIYSGIQWEDEDSKVMLISFAQNDEYAVQISYLLKEE